MSEKLTLLTSSTSSKINAITSYLELSDIPCFVQINTQNVHMEESLDNIFVKASDYENAVVVLNNFPIETEASNLEFPDQQAFPGLVILPIDFTAASENACYYALELATVLKSRIKLILTYGIPNLRPFVMEEGDFYQNSLNTQFIEIKGQIEEKLNELVQKLNNYVSSKSLPSIPISKLMIYGLLDEITLYASAVDEASLIILGISNENAASIGMVGKIASKIVEKSTIPILFVPEDMKFGGLQKTKNILYLTTFDESDFSAIQKLISIVKNISLNIFCLHIETGTINPWDRIKMNGLKEYFKTSYDLTNVMCDLVTSDNLIKTLEEFIETNKIEMITVINHKQNALLKLINPGITKKILFHTRIPLLVFHD